MDYQTLANEFLSLPSGHDAAMWTKHAGFTTDQYFEFIREVQKQIQARKQKKYLYLVTFTIDPKKHPNMPQEPEKIERCERFIRLQAKRSALKITKFLVSREYHQNEYPHWHAYVQTTKPLCKSRLTHYTDHWGRIDISKNKCQIEGDLLEYISKYSEPYDALGQE